MTYIVVSSCVATFLLADFMTILFMSRRRKREDKTYVLDTTPILETK
jgi:hypothetical protein